jgi:hypothetical protein
VSNIPEGITPADVLSALTALDAGTPHEFGDSTGYDLVHNRRRYPPKAVLGLAARRILGSALGPYDFKGGEKSQCFRVLRELGFTIEAKDVPSGPGTDWSEEEARAVVEEYFAMLAKEARGERYSKTAHRESLLARLPGRSNGSVEFKLANVSAVLTDLGFPYIEGYKPRGNYQDLLADLVLEHLGSAQEQIAQIEEAAEAVPATSPEIDLDSCEATPPPREERDSKRLPSRARASRTDFAARDARNRALGNAGERYVIAVEKGRLARAGFVTLAEQVAHVSETEGDGLGYDVRSFSLDDQQPIFIEVKTTNCPREFPFHVSANEVLQSARLGSRFRLYRVFNFNTKPQFYVLPGSIADSVDLRPTQYLATRR